MEIREGIMKLIYLLFLFALGELTEQQIAAILEDAVIKDDEEWYCINAGNIGRVCEGKRKTCGGYHWRYL